MKKTFFVVAFCLIAALSISAQVEKRVALVIGNGKYQFNTVLKNPPNDAQDMTASLKAKGFAVAGLINATRAEMEKAIRDFGLALKDPNAVGLFFYSGHGTQAEGQNYILPVDADVQDADELRYKAVDAEEVLAKMRSAGNKLNIVILDACRNNPFPGASKSAERGLAVVKVKVPESIIVYATDPGATAADGEGRNSPFTQAFLAQMEVPGQDIVVMMKRVTSAVRSATNDAQSPWVSSNMSADFAFRPSGAGAAATPSPVQPPAAATPTVSITRAYGSLVVTAVTAGSLYLDSVKVADLPAGAEARLDNIEAGDRVLELRYGTGDKESKTLSVQKNVATAVSFSWKKPASQAPAETAVASGGFVRVPAGSFPMGSPASEPQHNANEDPQHEVRPSAFSIGQYEVTQGEWQSVMGVNPSNFKGNERLPVEQVSWYDILVYCNKRSIKEGLAPCYSISGTTDPSSWGSVPTSQNATWDAVRCDFGANGYRLPTEAEWEYACRAGTRTAMSFGDTLVSSQANFDGNNPYNVSTKGVYLQKTTPVGSYPANAWGIYDMHGNVWEWCWDWYDEKYYGRSPAGDPRGAESGAYRVLRGGSWINFGYPLRSANRNYYFPYYRLSRNGFRVVVGR